MEAECWLCNDTKKLVYHEHYIDHKGKDQFVVVDEPCPICTANKWLNKPESKERWLEDYISRKS